MSAYLGDTLTHRAANLCLEQLAVGPYLQFVYNDPGEADLFRERLFDEGSSEFLPSQGKLLLMNGQPCGMICCMPTAVVSRCRMKAAIYFIKSGLLDGRDDLRPTHGTGGRGADEACAQ
jgi:hypothetical protein